MAYVPPGKRRAEAKAEAKDDGGAKPDSLLATVSSYFRDQAFGAAKGEGLEVVYEEFVLANCEQFEEDEGARVVAAFAGETDFLRRAAASFTASLALARLSLSHC